MKLAILVAVPALAQQTMPELPPVPVLPQGQPQGAATPAPQTAREPITEEEWTRRYFRIKKVPKKDVVMVGENRLRVHRMSARIYEVVGEEGDFYLVRNLPLVDPASSLHGAWQEKEMKYVLEQDKREFLKDMLIVADGPDLDPPFTDKLVFRRADEGLPRKGKWQMSFDVADLNADGALDLVFPPQRSGDLKPSIFTRKPDGSWVPVPGVRWPATADLDYGAVRVSDFDLDGNLDIAIACHFKRSYVLYGDGKGDFTRFATLPVLASAFSARYLTVADFNNDRRPDIALMAELDVLRGSGERISSGLVQVVLNQPGGWAAAGEGFPTEIMGDWLSATDFDRDGWTDLLLTTRKVGILELFFRNVDAGRRWEPAFPEKVPVNSYVYANAVAPMDGFDLPDVVVCFEQFSPLEVGTPAQACAVYHFHDAAGAPAKTPEVVPFVMRHEEYNVFKVVAVGDVDGDRRNDVVTVTYNGEVTLFLQFADGTLYREISPELAVGGADIFDARIVDLDGDGRGEVVLAGSDRTSKPGGVWVFSPAPSGYTRIGF